MAKNIKNSKKNSPQGFTLIEVMIAVSIFGLLLLFASQYMRSEIRGFDSASRQNEVQQKTRIAMMHILDEVRLNSLTYFKSTSNEQGIYLYRNLTAAAGALQDVNDSCLIFVNLGPTSVPAPSSAKVVYNKVEGKLWYKKNGAPYLIADEISQLNIEGNSSLVKIYIIAGGNNGSEPFELQTWVRLN